jgi:hypothetical protein
MKKSTSCRKKQQNAAFPHTRAVALFAAMSAAFLVFVTQVHTLEAEAVSFQANLLERTSAIQQELGEVAMVVETSDGETVVRRVSAAGLRAKERAKTMVRRNVRKVDAIHAAAKAKMTVPCEDQE